MTFAFSLIMVGLVLTVMIVPEIVLYLPSAWEFRRYGPVMQTLVFVN